MSQAARFDRRLCELSTALAPVFLSAYLLAAVVSLLQGSTVFTVTAGAIGAFVFLVEAFEFDRRFTGVYAVVACATIGYAFSATVNGRFDPGYFTMLFAGPGIAMMLLKRKMPEPFLQGAALGYLLLAAWFCFKFATTSDGNKILPVMSKNGISATMIYFGVMLHLLYSTAGKRLLFWPAVVSLGVCLLAEGRSGVIASSLILLGTAVARVGARRLLRMTGAGAFALLLPVLILVSSVAFSDVSAVWISRFRRDGLGDQIRTEIFFHYLQQLDLLRVFSGYSLRTDQWLQQFWAGNPHNSFVLLHSLTGLAGLGAVLVSGAEGLGRALLKNRLHFVLLLAVIARAATDSLLFFGVFDFAFFALVASVSGPIYVKR